MGFQFEKKTYGWRDLLRIPYQCSPSYTIYTMAQKLFTGVVCVLLLFIEAAVIDRLRGCRAGDADIRSVFLLIAVFFAGIIWKRMGYSFGRVLTKRVQGDIEYQFQKELVKKCACVPYRLLEDRIFQNIKTYLEQNAYEVIWMIMQQMGNALLRLVRILGIYLIYYMEDIRLGFFMTIITLPIIYFSICSAKKAEQLHAGSEEKKRRADYYLELIQSGGNIEERTLFDSAGFLGERYEEAIKGCKSGAINGKWQTESSAAAEAVVINVVFTLAILFQIAFLAQGRISLGTFTALTIGSHEAMFSLYRGMNHAVMAIERGIYFLDYLTAMANMPEVEGINEQPKDPGMVFAELEFVDVSFRYPRAVDYVLKHLSFKLLAGRKYAFVGENGAGKSTIARILAGMYDSYEGKILINGKELRDYSQGERKAIFTVVFQDSVWYEAAAARNIDQNTDVRLSDGQWQKLLVSRLLANPKPVSILDEPAVALDPIAEGAFYEQLTQPEEAKTLLLISHRLGPVKRADRIFVLKEGAVTEQGTHEELLRNMGVYAGMYESQSEWFRGEDAKI